MSGSDDTRARLLRGALQLFAERGIAKVTIRDLNAAAKIRNQSAIYYHFRGRDGLLLVVLQEAVESLQRRQGEALGELQARSRGAPDLRTVLRSFLLTLARAQATEHGRWRLQLMVRVLSEGGESAKRELTELLQPFSRSLADALRMAVPELSETAAPVAVLLLYNTALHTLIDFGIREYWELPVEQAGMLESLLDFIEGGVRALAT